MQNNLKELSNKLFLWTNNRWIITLSKKRGEVSVKEKNQINQKQIFEEVKKSNIYKQVLEILPDAELVDVKKIDKLYSEQKYKEVIQLLKWLEFFLW